MLDPSCQGPAFITTTTLTTISVLTFTIIAIITKLQASQEVQFSFILVGNRRQAGQHNTFNIHHVHLVSISTTGTKGREMGCSQTYGPRLVIGYIMAPNM